MNDLVIRYSISKKVKAAGILSGVYLSFMSLAMSIFQVIEKQFSFFFFAGIVGVLFASVLILSVTLWLPKPIIVISNDRLLIRLPKQKIDGEIYWDNVSKIGIGLSFLTLSTAEGKEYKIDLENLKYSDLRAVKTKIMEICEAKEIPYGNL